MVLRAFHAPSVQCVLVGEYVVFVVVVVVVVVVLLGTVAVAVLAGAESSYPARGGPPGWWIFSGSSLPQRQAAHPRTGSNRSSQPWPALQFPAAAAAAAAATATAAAAAGYCRERRTPCRERGKTRRREAMPFCVYTLSLLVVPGSGCFLASSFSPSPLFRDCLLRYVMVLEPTH